MKRWLYQSGIGSIFLLTIAFITTLLYFTQNSGSVRTSIDLPLPLIVSLHNLYFVPILIAAVFLGETWCIAIALVAMIGSGLVENRFHLPADMLASWSIVIRGAFFVALGYLASMTSQRMRASGRSWQSLLEITRAINASLDLDETLQAVTRKSVELTSADACAICLLNDHNNTLSFAKSSGLSERYLGQGATVISEGSDIQQVLRDGNLVVRDVRRLQPMTNRQDAIDEGIMLIMYVPLRKEDRVIGLLNLYRKRKLKFSNRDIRVARAFAEQVAIAVQNAELYASIRKNYLDTVRAFTRALEAKDALALGHSERVAEISVSIAAALKLTTEEIQTIEFGALLHDLGRISLEDDLLAKVGELTLDERVLFEMHPMIGKSILEPVEFLRPAIPIVLYHHERWDGQGYPERLAGTSIPLLARIVALANGYDRSMYHTSPFPLLPDETLERIRSEAGTAFDPQLVNILTVVLTEKIDGVRSQMNDRALGQTALEL